MAPKRSKSNSPDKSEGSDAPDALPVTPEAMQSDENDAGQKDAAARDDVDADAELQMGDRTEERAGAMTCKYWNTIGY